jgi:hypothetical protein
MIKTCAGLIFNKSNRLQNFNTVVFVGLGTRTKGKGSGMAEETDVLNSLQRKL